jgi:hypothetical protein
VSQPIHALSAASPLNSPRYIVVETRERILSIDWRDGPGTVAQSQAQKRFPGHDDAARFNRPDGTGTMALARCMAHVVMRIPGR